MSKSKQKGTKFENEVAEKLNQISGVNAKRVVGSGMFAQGDSGSEFFGDVRANTPVGELVIECKWRTASGWKTLEKWLGEESALVLRAPHEEAFVFLRWDLFSKLLAERGKPSGMTEAQIDELAEDVARAIREELKP